MQTLFDPPTRSTMPETSFKAAKSVTDATVHQHIILNVLRVIGPMSDQQIYDDEKILTRMSPSGARTRRSELVKAGLVRDSGQRGRTESGRETILWEAV